jgi:hypothetical protein
MQATDGHRPGWGLAAERPRAIGTASKHDCRGSATSIQRLGALLLPELSEHPARVARQEGAPNTAGDLQSRSGKTGHWGYWA